MHRDVEHSWGAQDGGGREQRVWGEYKTEAVIFPLSRACAGHRCHSCPRLGQWSPHIGSARDRGRWADLLRGR